MKWLHEEQKNSSHILQNTFPSSFAQLLRMVCPLTQKQVEGLLQEGSSVAPPWLPWQPCCTNRNLLWVFKKGGERKQAGHHTHTTLSFPKAQSKGVGSLVFTSVQEFMGPRSDPSTSPTSDLRQFWISKGPLSGPWRSKFKSLSF